MGDKTKIGRDPIKRRECHRRHREKLRIEKYGPECIGKDMRGKHKNHVRGPKHYRWSDDRMICDEGYVKIRVGVEHPLADPNGYAYEHLVVWASAGRTLPTDNENLHHIDEEKTNNRISNLELLTSAEHSFLHATNRWSTETENANPR